MSKAGNSSSSMIKAWEIARKKHPNNVTLQRKYVMNHSKKRPN